MTGKDPLSLDLLDPESRDSGYWTRFHRSVMERVAPELARRAEAADVTVSQVVLSWARTVVPTALAAAAAAALLTLAEPSPRVPESATDGIEELLVGGLGDVPIPVVLSPDGQDAADGRTLTMEGF